MRTILALLALTAAPTAAQTTPAPAGAATTGQPATPAPSGGQANAAGAAAAQLAAGATVYHTSGAVVGTIKAVTPNGIILSTGANDVTIPAGSFGNGPQGPILAATREEIDQAAGAANAQRTAQVQQLLVAGAPVLGAAGNQVGTVKQRDGEFAVVTTDRGDVRLPLASFAANGSALSITLTAEQFDAAVAQATAANRPG